MATSPRRSAARRAGAQVPDRYDPQDFPSFAVTVDIVILTLVAGRLSVLLVERGGAPYEGFWALPGGFKKPDESLLEAAHRELEEETGATAPGRLVQCGAYGDPGRDPRMNVVTVCYLAIVRDPGQITAGSDARRAELWNVDDVLDGSIDLAFDHGTILRDAVEMVRRELGQGDLAISFVDDTFSLSELRAVYEGIWGEPLDPANFRRSLLTKGHEFVRSTGRAAGAGPDGGRPPTIFEATDAWSAGSPIRRSPRRIQRRSDD